MHWDLSLSSGSGSHDTGKCPCPLYPAPTLPVSLSSSLGWVSIIHSLHDHLKGHDHLMSSPNPLWVYCLSCPPSEEALWELRSCLPSVTTVLLLPRTVLFLVPNKIPKHIFELIKFVSLFDSSNILTSDSLRGEKE